jgi:hypothetical protein
MVLLFGLLIIPAGVTSIVLIMLQPIAVGFWCGLCIFTAALMLFMVPLAFDEVIASCQFLYAGVKDGKSFWQLLFHGNSANGTASTKSKKGMAAGLSFPWTLSLAMLVSIAIMFIPTLFSSIKPMSNVEYIVGALAITVTVSALAEPCRALRLVNLLIAPALILAALLIPGATTASLIADVVLAVLLCALSIPKGKIYEDYGNWQKFIV